MKLMAAKHVLREVMRARWDVIRKRTNWNEWMERAKHLRRETMRKVWFQMLQEF